MPHAPLSTVGSISRWEGPIRAEAVRQGGCACPLPHFSLLSSSFPSRPMEDTDDVFGLEHTHAGVRLLEFWAGSRWNPQQSLSEENSIRGLLTKAARARMMEEGLRADALAVERTEPLPAI